MKAAVWNGAGDVRVETVKDPEILNPRDAIVRVTATAICDADLQLYNGFLHALQPGDILGHEFMGMVEEVGPSVTNLRPGDRVVVPLNVACGGCEPCARSLWALCDNSNPNAGAAERLYGYAPAGIFGYSQLFGGYSGAQAEFVRVPFADIGPLQVPDLLDDEQVLYLSDTLPDAYAAVEKCYIERGDVVAVWGCGPIGQLAIRCAFMLGAEAVVAIDRNRERLAMAHAAGAQILDVDETDVLDALFEMTGGRGLDACICCAGNESHGIDPGATREKTKQCGRSELDGVQVLELAIRASAKGATVSIPGVYAACTETISVGTAFEKSLQLRLGRTHTHRYLRPLLERIRTGEIDASFVVTHRGTLEDVPDYYKLLAEHEEAFVMPVIRPDASIHREAGDEIRVREELTIYEI